MLFSRRKCKHEATLTVSVSSLPDETARHLTHILLAGSDHATIGSAKTERYTKRLRFHGNNVGLPGRFDNAKRNCLADRNYQHCAVFVRDVSDSTDILNSSKKVWRLNQNARRIGSDRFLKLAK